MVAVDDFSLGRQENLEHLDDNTNFKIIKMDLIEKKEVKDIFTEYDFKTVFHLAANSDIQKGIAQTDLDLKRNYLTSVNVLEEMRKNKVKEIIFPSTSAIYGDVSEFLHEDFGPLLPTSFYGASKLAAEAYIAAYSQLFDIRSWICRFPNVVGERATHGVIYDLINKLKRNAKILEVLGDGKQNKPYLYVKDLIDAMCYIWKNSKEQINYYNIGVNSTSLVSEIAEMLVSEMGLEGQTKIKYTGSRRGWPGDVPHFQYDISKLKQLGWEPTCTSNEAVRIAIQKMVNS